MIKAVPIPLATGQTAWVHAGPTREMPEGYKLIRCAEEIPVEPDRVAYDVATRDFQTFNGAKLELALPDILSDLQAGDPLYIGCMGGTGRTGTMLAILVAQHPAFTGPMAIHYIRQVYKPGAVETKEQERQVAAFAGQFLAPEAPFTEVDEVGGWGEDLNSSAKIGAMGRLLTGAARLLAAFTRLIRPGTTRVD